MVIATTFNIWAVADIDNTSFKTRGMRQTHSCDTLSINGYTDWFLPSANTVVEIYQHKAAIKAGCISNGGTATGTFLWTSKEEDATFAKSVNMSDGNVGQNEKAASSKIRLSGCFER